MKEKCCTGKQINTLPARRLYNQRLRVC